LDPKSIDVIVQHWQTPSGKEATLHGDRRIFGEIHQEACVIFENTFDCRKIWDSFASIICLFRFSPNEWACLVLGTGV
jgi:hypothetical protein